MKSCEWTKRNQRGKWKKKKINKTPLPKKTYFVRERTGTCLRNVLLSSWALGAGCCLKPSSRASQLSGNANCWRTLSWWSWSPGPAAQFPDLSRENENGLGRCFPVSRTVLCHSLLWSSSAELESSVCKMFPVWLNNLLFHLGSCTAAG